MEPAEDSSLEAAIGWLVQTIRATLLIDKLKEWIRQIGLADGIEELKSEIRRVGAVVSAVKGRSIGNEQLAESLALLKELLYGADDVVDELDYYRLQQQVQGVAMDEPEDMHQSEQVDHTSRGIADVPSRGGGKKRWSKAWDDFDVTQEEKGKPVKARCKHCLTEVKCATEHGTSGMRNHNKVCKKKPAPNDQPPNPSSTADATTDATPVATGNSSNRKRRRTDEESAQITAANTHTPWDKAELSNRIQKITSQLQDIRGEVSEVLKLHGPDSATSSNRYLSTTSDQYRRTSSLVTRKVYGRVAEKNTIIKLMTDDRSDGVTVLPIVGIAGVGKTALAQLVYNDPTVKSQFHHRVWVWVSHNFDEVRLTREMLDSVSPERHGGSPQKIERYEGITSFAKLQEILKGHIEYQSKRILLVLDDVWDNMDDYRWNKLLAPLTSSSAKGNVILVTTRSFSVGRRAGTVESIKLGALAKKDFWLLCKAHAFGDENYDGHQSLSVVGRQIAEKLKGNPLAAETAGALLRENLSVDHWSNILMNEDWKSLQISRGIMPALKLSYDQLPYRLQQCFSYCSIFPGNYRFLAEELIGIWISQGFVTCGNLSKRLEETGWDYLTDLVNLGFLQQVEEEEENSSLGSQIWYSMCGLMHDFARIVSRTECATIDGLQCNKMLPTTQHLSIVTGSAYIKDQHGNIPRNNKFEEKLQNTVTSVGKLRTLVLIGNYDYFFFQLFQDIFQKAHNLRLLQVSATSTDFNSFMCSLVNTVHLRYLKCESDVVDRALAQILSKSFHLQVLDVGLYTYPTMRDGINNLVSLRHLVLHKGVYFSIASIGNMTSLQEYKVQISSGSEITQLQSMNKVIQLGVSQLYNVKSREEAYGAGLRNKEHLEKLHLSWMCTLPEDEYVRDNSSESSVDISSESSAAVSSESSADKGDEYVRENCPESSADIRSESSADKGKELSRTDDSGPSSEPYVVTAREVLEGLEPHLDLKHLRISGYYGITSPTWLASNVSVTSLQTLHLEHCTEWRILPSLGRLPFLTKLKLRNMRKVIEVLVPSLEELVLVEMPKLERCSCTSVAELNSSLRVLEIVRCPALKVFDLFEDGHKFEIEQKSWLRGLRKLIMRECPRLKVLNPLPPSIACSELLISGVSTLPTIKGSFSGMLCIGFQHKYDDYSDLGRFDESSDELWILDDKILAFHNLRSLRLMTIQGCRNLTSISFEGFSQLVSLMSLEIYSCEKLFSSHVLPERIREDMPAANCKAFPSLESLAIKSCGIAGKWLPLMLRHAPVLEELILRDCPHITTLLSMEEEENTAREDSSSGNPDGALTGLAPEGFLHIPLNPISSLKKITFQKCRRLTFDGIKEGLSRFTALEKLVIAACPKMISSLVHKDGNDDLANGRWLLPQSLGELEIYGYSQETLQPCFPRNLTCLKKLEVRVSSSLKSLQLHSCTALEELTITGCYSLAALEGLQSLGSLTYLEVVSCFDLPPLSESFSRAGYALCPRLETLVIDDPSVLTTSLCRHLTSLQRLRLRDIELTDEQERALVLLKSLRELEFVECDLVNLPAGLHTLPSLKRLKIQDCSEISRLLETGLPPWLEELEINDCGLVNLPAGLHTLPSLKRLKLEYCLKISRLPETGLPPSLEELEIEDCSEELADQCRLLATSKLNVKITQETMTDSAADT